NPIYRRLEKIFGPPQLYYSYIYDAIFVVAQAAHDILKKGLSITRATMLDAIPNVSFEGATGLVQFGPDGERTIANYALYNIQSPKEEIKLIGSMGNDGIILTDTPIFSGNVTTIPTDKGNVAEN